MEREARDFVCCGCIATTRYLLRLFISSGFGAVLRGDYPATEDPTPHLITHLIPGEGAILRSLGLGHRSPAPRNLAAALGRAPCSRTHSHTHAPCAPTRAATLAAAAHVAACSRRAGWGRLRGARGGRSQHLDELSEDAVARGVSPPSVHQSPDTSEIRLWVCGERNATQTPFY